MEWGQPDWIWAELAPGFLLVAAALAEWGGYRRLQRFGDPKVLGVSVSWTCRIFAWLLLAAGMAAAAAVLPLPAREAPAAGLPPIELLVDIKSLETASDAAWKTLDEPVAALMEQAPGIRFSLTATGNPPETVVAATYDAEGMQMLLGRLAVAPSGGPRNGLKETLAAEAAAPAPAGPARRRIVITSMREEELEQLLASQERESPALLFVTLGGNGRPVRYGRRSAAGAWDWTLVPGELAPLLTPARVGSGARFGLSLIQVLALLALLLLGGEKICRLAARTRPQGGSVD